MDHDEEFRVARRAGAPGSRVGATAPERGSVPHGAGAIEYEVVRSARRRRTLQLTVDGSGVRVAAPLRTPRREIEDFVRGRTPWILKHQPAAPHAPLSFATGDALPFRGHALPLAVQERRGRGVAVERGLFGLEVRVPRGLTDERRTRAIEQAVLRWLGDQAREAVERSVARWAPLTGRAPSRVLVRNQRQRWGSCSPDGTLRFNWRLVMLEESLLDYVVVHELTHLEVANHAPAFWRAVSRVMPDHAARRARMREAAATLPPL